MSKAPDKKFSLSSQVPRDSFDVTANWPHDPSEFTEGLIFYRGALWESTGHYGASNLREVQLGSQKILRQLDLSSEYFAEGITIFQDRLFQLTYQEHKCFVYDPNSLQVLQVIPYDGEGWGLTHDDRWLIMTDGTNRIRFVDPANFKTVRIIEVDDDGGPVQMLNELEYVNGEIYANIWRTDLIVRIDPTTGRILGAIDVGALFPVDSRHGDKAAWANGIAYDEAGDRLFITGKHWPQIFQIRIRKNHT